MTVADLLHVHLRFREALALGAVVSLVACMVVTARSMHKLRGAGIVGRDMAKPDRPEIPEMGGLAVFLAFNMGAFAVLALAEISAAQQVLILASLVVAAGACITGVLDDLVELRQRFKAFIPFAFAAPLSLFAPDYTIHLPHWGNVDFGLAYPLLLVPLAVACASNGFNMLEGLNGLGAGLGIILAGALGFLIILHHDLTGLVLLLPLVGALAGFLWFNSYPARIFPGDSMTLLVGAVLALSAILSKVEFWGALLFLPHVVEFILKLRSGFNAESFPTRVEDGRLVYEGPIQSLTHPFMKWGHVGEAGIVVRLWMAEAGYAALIVAASIFGPRLLSI